LHQFRSRTIEWTCLLGTEQMIGGDRLIVYYDTPRGMRFVADYCDYSFVATGGLSHKSPLFMQIVASVLNEPVAIHQAEHGPALGAAILGALAAGSVNGGFDDVTLAVDSMAGAGSALRKPTIVNPQSQWTAIYHRGYALYREFADEMARPDSFLRRLHGEG